MTRDDELLQSAIIDQINAELGARNMAMTELATAINRPYDSTRNYLKKERVMPLVIFIEICTALNLEPDALVSRARDRLRG